jgi:hypothetical protein
MENRLYTRPRDKTLEAFKAWIIQMTEHLTGKKGDDGSMTEQEWIEAWKKFWEDDPEQ